MDVFVDEKSLASAGGPVPGCSARGSILEYVDHFLKAGCSLPLSESYRHIDCDSDYVCPFERVNQLTDRQETSFIIGGNP